MKTIGFVGTVAIGPWRIPQKAQTALLQQHAAKEKLTIEHVVSEFVVAEGCITLLQTLKKQPCENILFVSAFQLPSARAASLEILTSLRSYRLYFALEDLVLEPHQDPNSLLDELAVFHSAKVLSSDEAVSKSLASLESRRASPTQNLFLDNRVRSDELQALAAIERNFDAFPIPTRQKLENFPNWVRHRDLARFLFKSEIYRSIVHIPGVIFEAGVLFGGSLATWLHLGEIYEPVNYGRRVYGFDTFSGFPQLTDADRPRNPKNPELYQPGTYSAASAEENIVELFGLLDKTRKIPQIPRMRLVKGDVCQTVQKTLAEDKSLLVALLYVDVDLYEPSKAVIEACLPRMPKGSVIVIDELCYEDWPGETQAILDLFDVNKLEIVRSPTVPNIAYVRL